MTTTPKNLGSILDRHRELAATASLAAAVRGELPREPGGLLDFEKARRSRLVERLEQTREARGRAIERFDSQVARIEKQIAELDELVGRAEEEARPRPKRPEKGKSAPGRGLADVEGVGPAYRKRLADAGYADADAVADADPERLAEAIGIAPGRAATIVANAAKLRRG